MVALVLVDAIVDEIKPKLFRVTATAKPPHDEQRIYEIQAKSDRHAAMEGIQRLVDEIEMRKMKDKDHASTGSVLKH